ncbi:MAG: DUF4430 domain-containing protein [Ruminococcaceae bacterium]|nr:DUF4430 domain-containing protein [Oscillospiraceae bacterium]
MKFPKVKNPFTVIGILAVVILLGVTYFRGEKPASPPAPLPTVSPTPHPSAAFIPAVPTASPTSTLPEEEEKEEERTPETPAASVGDNAAVEAATQCTFSIRCDTLVGNDALSDEKKGLVPSDGVIFAAQSVAYAEGESVWDVLYRLTRQHGIHLEYTKVPAYGSVYIEGIQNLYEFDGGSGSGWLFYVNGVSPHVGCSQYRLSPGDTVEFFYTCNYGNDYAYGG